MSSSIDTDAKLKEALAECARLREENERLKALLGIQAEKPSIQFTSATVTNDSPPDAKIALFRSLFRGRDDVYPVRWEGKNGKSGYSPSCSSERDRALCGKPSVKCSECENRKFLPVTDEVINHGQIHGSAGGLTEFDSSGIRYRILQDCEYCYKRYTHL